MSITDSMQKVIFVMPVLFGAFLSTPAGAAPQSLTLPQAVEFSLNNNGELKSFRDEKGIRDAGRTRAALFPNPTLELEGSTGALTGSPVENSVSIGVSQEFLLGGKRGKRLEVADREFEIYLWQLADRERLLTEEVKATFYDILLAEQRVALADRSITLSRQLLEVTRERLAAGDIPELEMSLAKVEVARAESLKIEAEKALIEIQAKLAALAGVPSLSVLSPSSSAFPLKAHLNKTVTELKALAVENRPDLKALKSERGRGNADILLARAEGVPNLTAGIALSRDTISMETGGVEGKDTDYIIGIKLSIPLPVFDRNQAGVQEAHAKLNSTESRLAAAIANVEREVEATFSGYLKSEQVLSLYQGSVLPQLEENLSLVQEAYRLGEVGILEVIQEQKKFSEVNDGYLAALHDRQTALVKLESAVAFELTGGVQ